MSVNNKVMLKYLNTKCPVNIEFEDLSYALPQGRKGSKLILRSISGEFKNGGLYGILGQSGCGKTSLLNILAGYRTTNVTGNIFINGQPRNLSKFLKLSRYIMQEDAVQTMLTVNESMKIAADLKLGRHVSDEAKYAAIDEILFTLKLINSKYTRTDTLSGGERRRLSIAQELINNPSVIYLDEPTTGLDDVASLQCIMLLKMLAETGRTVICSIHTPSAKIFQLFDSVYLLYAGQCVYQGPMSYTMEFLKNFNLQCPTTYNPADFLIEICEPEFEYYTKQMIDWTYNNYTEQNDRKSIGKSLNINANNSRNVYSPTTTELKKSKTDNLKFLYEFKIILFRNWLRMFRDKKNISIRIIIYLLNSILLGTTFMDMGNNGAKVFFLFGLYFIVLVFFLYISLLPALLNFPVEIKFLKREHFNRWYGINSYFLANFVSNIPIQMVLGLLYVIIVYFMTDQPLDIKKFFLFYTFCMLCGWTGESFGIMVSSTMNIVNSLFIGTAMVAPMLILAGYGMGQTFDTYPLWIQIVSHLSFLRFAISGITGTMFLGRGNLHCPDDEEICFLRNADQFFHFLGLDNTSVLVNMLVLVFYMLLFRGIALYLIKQRLCHGKTFRAIQFLTGFVKNQFAFR